MFVTMCYQQMRTSRKIRIKMTRLMEGHPAHVSRKSKIPELDVEYYGAINSFVKTQFKIAGQTGNSTRNNKTKRCVIYDRKRIRFNILTIF